MPAYFSANGKMITIEANKNATVLHGPLRNGPRNLMGIPGRNIPFPNDTHDKLSFGPNSFKFLFRHKRVFYRSPSVR